MPYRRMPSHGNTGRSRQLNVAYRRDVPLRLRAAPHFEHSISWQPESWQQTRQSRHFKWPLLVLIVGAVFAFAAFHDFSGKENVAHAAFGLKTAKYSPVKATAAEQQRLAIYKQTVNSLIASYPDEDIAVSSIDLSSNQITSLGDSGTFTAASTAKLITAVTLLHEVEQGEASLNQDVDGQPAGALLRNMIVDSDNDAWDSLNNDYLSHDDLKNYMASLGFMEYDPTVNTVQPSDIAQLLQKLYEGQLLNKSDTSLLLSYMQQANKTEYIVSDVPAGYTVYHKAGWLDGLMHDTAVISNGHRAIVLTIYTYSNDGVGDNPTNQVLFKQITAAALQAYF